VLSRRGVAVLDKGITIAVALRLAAKHHRDAESVMITWLVHYGPAKLRTDLLRNSRIWTDFARYDRLRPLGQSIYLPAQSV
jgi:hypothetical protein